MKMTIFTGLTLASALVAVPATAQDWYVSGAIGINAQNDSDNSGSTGAFTTGNLGDGTTLDVAAGTPYGWSTEFESGLALSGEVGYRYTDNVRVGVEIAYNEADVDTHTNVTLGGGSIDAVDAAAVAGSADPLGATVADVVADGRGDITSTAVFLNGYYDFNAGGAFQPYLGAGIGLASVDAVYNPSGVGIIDDGETKFAYQLKAGVSAQITDTIDVFGEYAYRATDDIDVNNDLFPGNLGIENQNNIFVVGARFRFG